ncbi:MAG: ABC transporter permease [Anaerolineae bacterium]|jgi:peptide/nickel transport system permease protein|nr:ABC transporter permease [Anaerolineae bacterium]
MSDLEKKPIDELLEQEGDNPLLLELEQFTKKDEEIFYASQSQLILWRFKRHKLAVFSLIVLVIMYIIAIVPGFFAPYGKDQRFKKYSYAPPSQIKWFAEGEGFVGPYIYALTTELDLQTFATTYIPNEEEGRYPLGLFVKGTVPYKVLGLFETNIRLFGLRNQTEDSPPLLLFGSDQIGRDVFSRTCYGAQISLTIGLVGVVMSFVMGIALGGLSGYIGGLFDAIILVIIDLLQTIPQLPLWMTLAAAVPREIPVVQRYFMMTVVLSFLGWTGLARVVRGRLLAMREEDYAMAAKGAGASNWRIVMHHLIPGFTSHLIVTITINIPAMILGEVSLGFLGLGMQKPALSWGVLLTDAQNIMAIANQPWMMIPAGVVIVTVLLFNFVGDGLRDAADPYVM